MEGCWFIACHPQYVTQKLPVIRVVKEILTFNSLAETEEERRLMKTPFYQPAVLASETKISLGHAYFGVVKKKQPLRWTEKYSVCGIYVCV